MIVKYIYIYIYILRSTDFSSNCKNNYSISDAIDIRKKNECIYIFKSTLQYQN